MLKKTMGQSGSGRGLLWKGLTFHFVPVTMILGQIIVLWLSAEVGFFPGGDRFLSIISTCAEIIAGLYGITLAGYTFFLSRIDGLMAGDETLEYVVSSIKNRFKYLIWYITSNVLMTLLISILLMYAPMPAGEEMGFFYRLFCNEFLMFMAFSVVLILCYSVQVINPNAIGKEARKLKHRLSGATVALGDAVAFIADYRQIREACEGMLPEPVWHQLCQGKGGSFELTLRLLEDQKMVIKPLAADIRRIHHYYACLVNSGDLRVSREMCQTAEHVLLILTKTSPTLLGKRG